MNCVLRIPAVHYLQVTTGLRKLFDKIGVQIRNLKVLSVRKEIFRNLSMTVILDKFQKDHVLEFNRKWPIYYTFRGILLMFLENELQSKERTRLVRSRLDSFEMKSKSCNNRFKGNFK